MKELLRFGGGHGHRFRTQFGQARARLLDAGAHEVINTVAELPEVIARLQARMEAG